MLPRNSEDFILEIEKLVRAKKMNYLDAIMFYVEKYDIDPELIASIVKKNANLKAKLAFDCQDLNLLEKTRTIPGL